MAMKAGDVITKVLMFALTKVQCAGDAGNGVCVCVHRTRAGDRLKCPMAVQRAICLLKTIFFLLLCKLKKKKTKTKKKKEKKNQMF